MQYRRTDNSFDAKNVSCSSSDITNKKEDKNNELIIDDNTVYEVDLECYERAKRNRLNQKIEWSKNKN